MPLDICLTASWTYIRMHGGQEGMGYSKPKLLAWVTYVRSFLAQKIDVYVYFNNDPDAHAIRNGQRLHALLNPG